VILEISPEKIFDRNSISAHESELNFERESRKTLHRTTSVNARGVQKDGGRREDSGRSRSESVHSAVDGRDAGLAAKTVSGTHHSERRGVG
jgi:hypothetical protein